MYLSYNLAHGAWSSYQNASRLLEAEKRLAKAKEENDNLRSEVKYRESEFFIEKEARDKLGLAKKGETVVVVPQEGVKGEQTEADPYQELSNPQRWWKVFFN